MSRHLGERARHLHAGGTTAHHHEGEEGPAGLGILFLLRGFERRKEAAADLDGIFELLERRRALGPFFVAEVLVHGPRGKDEVVVLDPVPAGKNHGLPLGVHVDDLAEAYRGILLVSEELADGRREVRWGEGGCGNLVEERLEQVMVPSVDERDPHRRAPQCTGSVQPGETAAHDHHVWSPGSGPHRSGWAVTTISWVDLSESSLTVSSAMLALKHPKGKGECKKHALAGFPAEDPSARRGDPPAP